MEEEIRTIRNGCKEISLAAKGWTKDMLAIKRAVKALPDNKSGKYDELKKALTDFDNNYWAYDIATNIESIEDALL